MATVAAMVLPSAAQAYRVERFYCASSYNPGEGCPPSGSSEWLHLYINEAVDLRAERETCIDEYLDGNNNGHYTEQTCATRQGQYIHQYPNGEWGEPRAWNGWSVYHWFEAGMFGN